MSHGEPSGRIFITHAPRNSEIGIGNVRDIVPNTEERSHEKSKSKTYNCRCGETGAWSWIGDDLDSDPRITAPCSESLPSDGVIERVEGRSSDDRSWPLLYCTDEDQLIFQLNECRNIRSDNNGILIQYSCNISQYSATVSPFVAFLWLVSYVCL